jgi:MFS family permease
MVRTDYFFGWKVVWVAFLIGIFAWGLGLYGPPIFLQTLHTTRGWPISTISGAITTHFLFSAFIVANLPTIHRHFGIVWVTIIGVGSTGLGIIALANAQSVWQLFPAALLTGVGYATTSAAAVSAMVTPWFDRDQPKALSLAFNGGSIAGVAFAPLMIFLISQFGLAAATFGVAIVMTILLWPLAIRFLGPTPSALGVGVDGGPNQILTMRAFKPTLTRAQLLRDRQFVTLSAASALALFAQIGLLTHLVARLAPTFGTGGAAMGVSLAATCAIAGRTLLGWFIGDHDRRVVASASLLVQAVGVLLLTFGSDAAVLTVGCVLFGLGVGNLISLPPLIAWKEFDRDDVGPIFALITSINQAVFALAPAFFGWLRDATTGYALPFAIAAAAYLLSALIVLAGRPPGLAR